MNVFELFAKLGLDSSEFEAGLDRARSAGSALGSGLASAAQVGLRAVTAATTAVAGMGAVSVKTGAEFDSSMSQVAATMGTTVDQIEELRDFAQEMGRTTAFSATQSADALNYMALAGYDAETSMAMLPNVLNLAAAGSIDLARASDMITDTQTAFGISLERTSQLVDEMAKAASTGNTSVEQLGDAFLTVGGLAAELNGGFVTLENGTTHAVDGVQELEIALTAMANAGIKGSEAGTHMRNMLLKLSSPTSDGTVALEKMGVAVFDTEGNMRSLSDVFGDLSDKLGEMTQEQKIQTISDLFNTRDLASAEALLNAVGEDWDKIGEAILSSQYNINDITTSLQTASIDWTKYLEEPWLKSAETMGDAWMSLGEQIAYNLQTQKLSVEETADFIANEYDMSFEDALTAVESVSEALGDMKGAAEQMKDTQLDNLAGDITLFKSALEGAQIAISDELTPSLRKFVQFGTDGLSRLTEAFQEGGVAGAMGVFGDLLSEGLNMIIEMLPDFVDGGIQLLEALGRGIIDNMSTITEIATEIISRLGSALTENLPTMITAGSDILSGLLSAITDNLDTITPIITQFIVGFVRIMADNADKMIEVAIAIAGAIGEGLIQAAPIIAESAPKIIDALTSAFAQNPAALIALGPQILGFILKGIKIAKPLIKGVGKLLSSGLGETIMSGLSSLGSTIAGFFSNLVSGIGTFLTSTVGTVLTGVVSSIVAFFAGAEIGKHIGAAIFPDDSELYEGYSGIMGTIQMLKDTFFAAVDFIKFAWEDLTAFFSGLWEGIKGAFASVGEWFKAQFKQGADNVKSVWDSIVGFYQGIWNGIVNIFNIVADWFKEKFESAKTNVTDAWNTVTKFFSDIWDGIKRVFEIVGTWFRDKFTEAKENVLSAWSDVKERFSEIWDNITSAFNISDALTWGKDMIDNFINGIKEKWNSLKETLGQTAEKIKEYLGFSEPEAGPLSNFHTYAPDMMDLFAQGIKDNANMLQDTVANAFDLQGIIADGQPIPAYASVGGGSTVDNTEIANLITDALRGIIVEVNIGDEKLDNIISTSIQRTNYRSGGR